LAGMLSRARPVPSGFIEPCLPSPADRPPTGPEWVHEIKHDGYRLMVRRDPIGRTAINSRRVRVLELEPVAGAACPSSGCQKARTPL
jgi:ATP-dependent DNA ligase